MTYLFESLKERGFWV